VLKGITLHKTLELYLDQGHIVIVPMPGALSAPTEWRMVVLGDDAGKKDIQWTNDQGNDTKLSVSLSYVTTKAM
jgi:hypothetical protein